MPNDSNNTVDHGLLDRIAERRRRGGGSEGGPPDLEARVSDLEEKFATINGQLTGIDTSIKSLQSSLDASSAKLDAKIESKASGESLARMEGELGGRLQGIEGRLSNIPTTWQTIAIIVGMLVGIAGVSFTISNLRQPPSVSAPVAPPSASAPSVPKQP